MSEAIAKRVFLGSTACLLAAAGFVVGVAVAEFHFGPYKTIRAAYGATTSLMALGRIAPDNLLQQQPADAARGLFTIHTPGSLGDGYYAILAWDDEHRQYSARLYDQTGQLLHTWPIDYTALDPDGPLNGSDAPHAFKLLPDGSLIVSFDNGDVMARLDSCSRPLWTKSGVFHHSLEPAEDGTFWTWRGDGSSSSQYQYLVNFDPETGETIAELGLVEDFIRNMGSASAVFSVRPDHAFERGPNHDPADDIFHPNDLDILSSRLAHLFPSFEAGDLLLSFANLHLVAVVDPLEKRLRWWSHGPWRFQHDPDFTQDGKISVYSNYSDRARSEIIKMDPESGQVSNELFPGNISFYSNQMGKHQYLPNGNVLIVVPEEGRVLEASARGDKVMEFNNLVAGLDGYNGHVQNAMWIPSDFFDTTPECTETS